MNLIHLKSYVLILVFLFSAVSNVTALTLSESIVVEGINYEDNTTLGDGRFVVTWSEIKDTLTSSLFAQIFNPDGTKFGEKISVSIEPLNQAENSSIAPTDSGGFIIIWENSDFNTNSGELPVISVQAKVFEGNGIPATRGVGFPATSFIIETNNADFGAAQPDISLLGNNEFIITWAEYIDNVNLLDIYARVSRIGIGRRTNKFPINSTTKNEQRNPSVAELSDGRYVIAWEDNIQLLEDNSFTSSTQISAQIFDVDGSLIGDELIVNSTNVSNLFNPEVTPLTNNGFLISWESHDNNNVFETANIDVKAQLFDFDGKPVGTEEVLNTSVQGAQASPDILALEDGRFIATYENEILLATNEDEFGQVEKEFGMDIRAQVFNNDGSRSGEELILTVSDNIFERQKRPLTTLLNDGSIMLFWEHYENDLTVLPEVRRRTLNIETDGNIVIDSDGDGLSDFYEDKHNLDKNDPDDAQGDFDADGLTNLEEFQVGTDPNNPDTDEDTVSDRDEINLGTDPLNGNSFPISLTGYAGNQQIYLDHTPHSVWVDGYKVYVEKYDVLMGDFITIGTTTPKGSLELSTSIFVTQTFDSNDSSSSLLNDEIYRFTVRAVTNGMEGPASNQFEASPGVFAAVIKPTHPIVFLHGFSEDGRGTFNRTLNFIHSTLGWKDGGHLVHDPFSLNTFEDTTLIKEDGTMGFDAQGDFFTVDFGDKFANDGGYRHQGREIPSFLGYLKSKNSLSNDVGSRFPVSLVAHSNGGLAARSFLVNHPAAVKDIAEFVTYGTPHRGADVTTIVNTVDDSKDSFNNKLGVIESSIQGCDENNNPILSSFLEDLNDLSITKNHLPKHIRYTSIIGRDHSFFNLAAFGPINSLGRRPNDCQGEYWDGLVSRSSADLNTVGVTSSPVRMLETDEPHIGQGNDFSAILWALAPNPLDIKVLSAVDIEVIAPDGRAIARNFTSILAASHREIADENGYKTTRILIPFPLAGDYVINVTAKPGALPTDTYTIESTLDGKTTVLVKDQMVKDIPAELVGVTVPEYVSIYIKQGAGRKRIKLGRKGKIKVAILSSDTFDATTVEPSSVKFGLNNAHADKRVKIKDVNKDGLDDLELRFKIRKTGIFCGDSSVSITGETFDGEAFKGKHTIKTVKCKKHKHKQ